MLRPDGPIPGYALLFFQLLHPVTEGFISASIARNAAA
jgi:hypothetical protein